VNGISLAVVFLTGRREANAALGIMHFMGSHQLDIGMVATGS